MAIFLKIAFDTVFYTSGKSVFRDKIKTVVNLAVPGRAVWTVNSRCTAVLVKNPNYELKKQNIKSIKKKENQEIEIVKMKDHDY